jgi:hypothetical protein
VLAETLIGDLSHIRITGKLGSHIEIWRDQIFDKRVRNFDAEIHNRRLE